MSFARHNPGRSLYGHTDTSSVREKELLAENKLLRAKNKRLSEAVLTLVDHIETKLPYLEGPKSRNKRHSTGYSESSTEQHRYKKTGGFKNQHRHKVEVLETFEEPIEFAEPAPEMRFGKRRECESKPSKRHSSEYKVSPDLAPDEIDLLKSPTKDRFSGTTRTRKKVDVVDLELGKKKAKETPDFYKAGSVYSSEIPTFDFQDEEPVIDIEFKRRETLRAAMRRRVNRLRW
jgi:hypothetical protein